MDMKEPKFDKFIKGKKVGKCVLFLLQDLL